LHIFENEILLKIFSILKFMPNPFATEIKEVVVVRPTVRLVNGLLRENSGCYIICIDADDESMHSFIHGDFRDRIRFSRQVSVNVDLIILGPSSDGFLKDKADFLKIQQHCGETFLSQHRLLIGFPAKTVNHLAFWNGTILESCVEKSDYNISGYNVCELRFFNNHT
jgi:hypothetical protein